MPTSINNRLPRSVKRPRLFAHDARRMQAHFEVRAGDLFVGPDNREHVVEHAGFRAPQIFTTNRPGHTQASPTSLTHRPFFFPDDDDRPQTHEQRAQLLAHSDSARQVGLAAIAEKIVIDDDTRHALAIRDLLEFTDHSQPNPRRAVNALLLRQDPEAILALANHPVLAPFELASLKTLLTYGDLSLACGYLVQLWQKQKYGSFTITKLVFELEKMQPKRVMDLLAHLVDSGQKDLANRLIRAGLDLPDTHPDKCHSVIFDAYLSLQQQNPESYLPFNKITATTTDFIVSTLRKDLEWTLREMPELFGAAIKHARFVREISPSLQDAFTADARAVVCDRLAKPLSDEKRIQWKRIKNNLAYLQQSGMTPAFFNHFLRDDLASFGLRLVLPSQGQFLIQAANEAEPTELLPAKPTPTTGRSARKATSETTTALARARRTQKAIINPNDVWKAEILSLIAEGQFTMAAELAFFPLSELPKRWHFFSACLDPAVTAQLLASLIQVDYVVQVLQAIFNHTNDWDPDLETEVIQILAHLPTEDENPPVDQITLDAVLNALLCDPEARGLGVAILIDSLFYGTVDINNRFSAAYDRMRAGEDWFPLPYMIQTGRLSTADTQKMIRAANEASYQAQAITAIQKLNANQSDSDAIKDARKLLKDPSGPAHIKELLTRALLQAAPDAEKTIQKLKNRKNAERLKEMVAAKDNNSIAALMALMEIKADLRGLDIVGLPLADDRYRPTILAYLEYTVEQSERASGYLDEGVTVSGVTREQLETEYRSCLLMIDQLIHALNPTQKLHLAARFLLTTVGSKNPIVKSYGGYADKWFGDIPKAEILVEVSTVKAANMRAGQMVLECLEENMDDLFAEPFCEAVFNRFQAIITNLSGRLFLDLGDDGPSDADIRTLSGLKKQLIDKLYTRFFASLSLEDRVLLVKDLFKTIGSGSLYDDYRFYSTTFAKIWLLEPSFTLEQKAKLALNLLTYFRHVDEMTDQAITEMLKAWAELISGQPVEVLAEIFASLFNLSGYTHKRPGFSPWAKQAFDIFERANDSDKLLNDGALFAVSGDLTDPEKTFDRLHFLQNHEYYYNPGVSPLYDHLYKADKVIAAFGLEDFEIADLGRNITVQFALKHLYEVLHSSSFEQEKTFSDKEKTEFERIYRLIGSWWACLDLATREKIKFADLANCGFSAIGNRSHRLALFFIQSPPRGLSDSYMVFSEAYFQGSSLLK